MVTIIWINNGIEEHKVAGQCDIPEGYVKGRLKSNVKYVYFTDGKTSIRLPESVNPPEGFYKGRLKRKMSEEEKISFNLRRRNTCVELYGTENYNNRSKAKQTCIEKYSVDNPSKFEETKAKIKNTFNSYYGGYTLSSPTLRKLYINTMITRYGVQNPM